MLLLSTERNLIIQLESTYFHFLSNVKWMNRCVGPVIWNFRNGCLACSTMLTMNRILQNASQNSIIETRWECSEVTCPFILHFWERKINNSQLHSAGSSQEVNKRFCTFTEFLNSSWHPELLYASGIPTSCRFIFIQHFSLWIIVIPTNAFRNQTKNNINHLWALCKTC